MEILLAQHVSHDGGGSLVLSIIALVGMIIPFFILAGVCWVFWKAKKREEAEQRRASAWPNAHSS